MNEKTFKKIARFVILTALVTYSLYLMAFTLTHPMRPQHESCGYVVAKSSDEVAIKHGTQTKLYLIVKFGYNNTMAVHVSPTTYFKHKIGSGVCFDMNDDVGFYYHFKMVFGLILLIFAAIVILVYVGVYIFYDDETKS